jgi:hypothetical protein
MLLISASDKLKLGAFEISPFFITLTQLNLTNAPTPNANQYVMAIEIYAGIILVD